MTLELSAQEPAVAAPAVVWFLQATPALVEGVEELPGLDDKPMLYHPVTGKYASLTPTAAKIARTFDGTRTGAQILAAAGITAEHPAAPRIAAMAAELRQLGFFTEAPLTEDAKTKISRFALREHMWRWELVKDTGRFLEPLTAPLRRFSPRSLLTGWAVLSLIGIAVGVYALMNVRVEAVPTMIWVLFPILVVQIVIHELAHAIVCQYQRVPVRSAGFGLMLYVMPVGYVDRTDSHRVTRRSGRVAISLAGPMSDQIWFGVAGVVALTAGPQVSSLAVVMMIFQILLTVMNFNPLTPSDGYHAATAALGISNLRGKSFALVLNRIFRSPLPAHLQHISARERRVMTAYGVLCLAFALVLAYAVFRSVTHLIGVL